MISALPAFVTLLGLAQAMPYGAPPPPKSSCDLEVEPVRTNNTVCSNSTVSVHKEWSALTTEERLDFTSSVKCLMKKPSRIPKEIAPGARSRYDDFAATHINQTEFIHNSGIFLSWHRHFLFLFEKALKEECNFKGSLPYWNWVWWTDLAASPLFDGSATSLSGDGFPNPEAPGLVNGNFTFPRGNGGGCIKDGPFANVTAPFKYFTDPTTWVRETRLEAAPHCITRDLNNLYVKEYLNQDRVDALLASPNITVFQSVLGDFIPGTPIMGPHQGGHYALGADMQDQFASPSDPAFFLHHGMIDLLWARWQAKDPENRQFALSGGSTLMNQPPTPDVTVDFIQDFAYLDDNRPIEELMDIRGGQYCYTFEYTEGQQTPDGY